MPDTESAPITMRPDGSIMRASPVCRWGGRRMSEIELREETIAASAEFTLKTA